MRNIPSFQQFEGDFQKFQDPLLWFLTPSILTILDYFFFKAPTDLSEEELTNFHKEKVSFIKWVSTQIQEHQIQFADTLPKGLDPEEYYIKDRPINRIIIHHTAHDPERFGLNNNYNQDYIQYLSTLQLLNLFTRYHSQPGNIEYKKPIYSGRNINSIRRVFPSEEGLIIDSEQLFESNDIPNFICYHYIIFADGSIIQTNSHNQYLWHAMNANRDSIGICVIGEYDSKSPTKVALQSLKQLIKILTTKHNIPIDNIVGHRESNIVHAHNHCPGNTFFGTEGWRNKIIPDQNNKI